MAEEAVVTDATTKADLDLPAELNPWASASPEDSFDGYGSAFGLAAVEALAQKGYCVIQTPVDDEERDTAAAAIRKRRDFQLFKEEWQIDYLGRRNITKVTKLEKDSADKLPLNALSRYDRMLTLVGLSMVPFTDSKLGFSAYGRYVGITRVPYSNKAEESKLAPTALMESDIEDGMVESYIDFVQSRKVCMLSFIASEGSEVTLFPKVGGEITITPSSNTLLIFRHDKMSFLYRPAENSVVLQSWMLGPVPGYELDKVNAEGRALDAVYNVEGPAAPLGVKAQIMSFKTRFPGESLTPECYWNMCSSGSDVVCRWSPSRFDEDLYYSPEENATLMGKSYTNHGGFIQDDELFGFACKLFGVPDEEAFCMSTNQRMTLEVAYDTLYAAGFTRKTLRRKHIGHYLGDVGMDWHGMTGFLSIDRYNTEYTATAIHNSLSPARLAHTFDLTGPAMTFDTACSASLVATHHAHVNMLNFRAHQIPDDGSICGGVNTTGASGFVGNCSAQMMSHIGRSFTFDRTADGFQRGEGCGQMYLKLSGAYDVQMEREACLAGSCANQDGKSASLTAPNGPSQQAVIRKSLRFAERAPAEVACVECHGTGTALGDPIEVGAVMAVMEGERENPLPETSAKSNMGHLESAAGIAGFFRCLVMLQHSATAPNCHLKILNAHLEQYGFPQLFVSELVDHHTNSGYSGVSSFGFGGTNARSDIYARSLEGPRQRKTVDAKKLDFIAVDCPRCMGPMCWRCGVALPTRTEMVCGHVCSLVREDPNYEWCSNCYKETGGAYRCGMALEDLDAWQSEKVFIRGTWNGCKSMDEMQMVDDGVYVAYIRLSAKGWEHFQVMANSNPKELFYPAAHKGGQTTRIMGPDDNGDNNHWLIDGRPLKVPPGSIYKVTFEWGDKDRKISWDVVTDFFDQTPLGTDYRPSCFIVGSWARWSLEEMRPASDSDDGKGTSTYEFTLKMGERCSEEFQFMLERDKAQAIYPAVNKADSAAIPVKGPGDRGYLKHFLVRGAPREQVNITLTIRPDARIAVTAKTASRGEVTWATAENDSDQYYVTGSFSSWKMLPMTNVIPGVFNYVVNFTDSSEEEFQIVLDGDWDRTLHPAAPSANLGESILQGPDGSGEGLHWCILGEPYATYEISLDLNEVDRRRIVSWEKRTSPAA